ASPSSRSARSTTPRRFVPRRTSSSARRRRGSRSATDCRSTTSTRRRRRRAKSRQHGPPRVMTADLATGTADAARTARSNPTGAVVLAVAFVATVARAGDDGPRFVVETNPFVVGQAADWLDRRHVVWHDSTIRDEDADGDIQIYRSTLDGAEKACLTCGLPGPNQVPVVQPHGRWILFHSWNGHAVTLGGPGFGGLGSDLWVMTRDGGERTNLTRDTELHDNFHAYWSPDGRYIVWTALNWNTQEGGDGKSDIRVA